MGDHVRLAQKKYSEYVLNYTIEEQGMSRAFSNVYSKTLLTVKYVPNIVMSRDLHQPSYKIPLA